MDHVCVDRIAGNVGGFGDDLFQIFGKAEGDACVGVVFVAVGFGGAGRTVFFGDDQLRVTFDKPNVNDVSIELAGNFGCRHRHDVDECLADGWLESGHQLGAGLGSFGAGDSQLGFDGCLQRGYGMGELHSELPSGELTDPLLENGLHCLLCDDPYHEVCLSCHSDIGSDVMMVSPYRHPDIFVNPVSGISS